MNRERMASGVRELLAGLLEGSAAADDPSLRAMIERTPERVADALAEDLLAGYGEDPAARLEPVPLVGARGPVVLEGIRFTSVCAHHLLPYRGEARVGFVPRGGHVGLGSLARVVDTLARRLTLQESLTSKIADVIERSIEPAALIVELEAEHLCLSVRGARKTGHRFRSAERRGDADPQLEALFAASRSERP